MIQLLLIYCAWLWVWAYLYNVTNYVNKTPLFSLFIGLVYTTITQLFFAKYSIGLKLFIIGIEAIVFYKTYIHFMKINKKITIKNLDLDYNIIAFLFYNIFLCLNGSSLNHIYFYDLIGKRTDGRNKKTTLKKWINKKLTKI